MATYYVTVNRPTIEAATSEEATQKALDDPLGPDDKVFVKEIPVSGSFNYTPGGAIVIGGSTPVVDATYVGPTLRKSK